MTNSIGRKAARSRGGLLNSTMMSAVALASLAVTPLMLPGAAQAETWLGVTGSYNDPANWSPAAVPSGTATFTANGAATGVTINVGASLTLLEYTSVAPLYTLTTADSVALLIGSITNSSTIEQQLVAGPTGGFIISGTITGPMALTAGPNSGAIQFNAGASASNSRFIGSGGLMNIVGFTAETLSIGSIEGTGIIRAVDGNAGTPTLSVGSLNSSTTYSGVIQGDLALTKVGTGTLTLAGANSYTGVTTVFGGTLALSGDGALASTGAVNISSATGMFSLSGANGDRTIGDLTGVVGSSVVLGANDLTVGTANSTTFNGGISGAGGLVKAGSGTLSLTRASTYSGGTTISAGTVSLGNASAIGTGGVNMTASGTSLLLNDNVVAIAGLDGVAGSAVNLGNSGVLGFTGASGISFRT